MVSETEFRKRVLVLVLIASYLFIVFVLPLALSAVVSYRAMPIGARCPHCREATILLNSRLLRIAPSLRLLAPVQRRWCLGCGWEGTTRPEPMTRVARTTQPASATHTLDVRSLTVDGRPWRVMLQYRCRTGLFYGRLMFIAPTGRLWLDANDAFTGATRSEVLGQALSMPDGLLTNRLRRLVRDY